MDQPHLHITYVVRLGAVFDVDRVVVIHGVTIDTAADHWLVLRKSNDRRTEEGRRENQKPTDQD